MADCKLYHEDNAANLKKLGFITRIPNTLKLVAQVVTQALAGNTWQLLDATTRYHRIELCHYGMAQRWLVVSRKGPANSASSSGASAARRCATCSACCRGRSAQCDWQPGRSRRRSRGLQEDARG